MGPEAKVMEVMGNKVEARNFVTSINVPVTRGLSGDAATILGKVDEIGFPVLVKAAGGGGGKGMRIVNDKESLAGALEAASREAKNYFADGTVYVEKYLAEPRHIEFQILGDNFGNVVHLFERECSIQRRYQKIIEESPSPTLTEEVRQKMGAAAVTIGKAIGYNNAGTIEFLVDKALNFYFLEMNTRIQVEHPVSEMITGIDLVQQQIFVAAGEKLKFRQKDIQLRGHAIECRLNAEDPYSFVPSPGKIKTFHMPGGPGVRIDTHAYAGYTVPPHYDSMIGKLITYGETRDQAIARMRIALSEMMIDGINTNIALHAELMADAAFHLGGTSIHYLEQKLGIYNK